MLSAFTFEKLKKKKRIKYDLNNIKKKWGWKILCVKKHSSIKFHLRVAWVVGFYWYTIKNRFDCNKYIKDLKGLDYFF